MIDLIILLFGLVVLGLGAELIVKTAQDIAKFFRISDLFIGLTAVSIGTSLPEIAVSVMGGLDRLVGIETSGIVIGNKIGSCLNQITIILGIVAILGTLYMTRRELKRDGAMLIASILVFTLVSVDLVITVFEGLLLIVIYFAYFVYIVRDEGIHIKLRGRWMGKEVLSDVLLFLVGMGAVIVSSGLILSESLVLAHAWGVKESLVGLLIVGLGTGMPELVISVMALRRRAVGISVGTLIGSNITDILFSLGAGAVIAGFIVERSMMVFDVPFMLIVSVLVLFLFRRKMRVGRKEGVLLILVYILYVLLKLNIFT